MTGTQNPSRQYFRRNQPYVYKSADNWEEWDTDESYDRTFFIGIDDVTDPEHPDVALYMIWGGKAVAVVGSKVLDTISGTVETVTTMAAEIQSVLDEVQRLATAVAQSEQDIEEAVIEINALVDRCEGILDGAEAARDLAKDWAVKMDGMVVEDDEPVDYSAKYYAHDASESATAAAGSAGEASDDADLAEDWATKTDGTVDGSEYSSKYYAGQSADSATTAGTKAGEASASATLASKWATQLTLPVEGGEYSAKKYAQDAGTSATNAGTSESNASGSANAAANSAALAQDWATKMDGQVASTDYSSKYYAGQAAISATNSGTWAEGSDADVSALGGTHSSKTWAEQAAISAAGTKFKLFQHQWFDYELDDMSWLRADTFSWQDGTVYSNAYNHLVDDIDGITASTETVGGYTVTYYQATDGHKIVLADQETVIANIYTATGVAWYYVLDTANNRFKLPRENPNYEELDKYTFPSKANVKIANTTTTLSGRSTPAAIVGQSANIITTGSSGQLYLYGTGSTAISGGSQAAALDADLSGISKSSYYKGKKYLYFYVGQYTQSATEQTAGLNAELFNGKLDLDAGNLSVTGKSTIASLCELNMSASQDVTATAYSTTGTGYKPSKAGVLWISGYSSQGGGAIWLAIYKNGTALFSQVPMDENGNSGGVRFINEIIVDADCSYRVEGGQYVGVRFIPYKGA